MTSLARGRNSESYSHGGGSSSKGGGSSSKSGGSSSKSSGSNSPSFLFVVNKLKVSDTSSPNCDCWGNIIPPQEIYDFDDEEASVVMRFRNGRISHATGYVWSRGERHSEGAIFRNQGNAWTPINCYDQSAIFSCNPHLPLIIAGVDPTVSELTSTYDSHYSVEDTDDQYSEFHQSARWKVLHFDHFSERPGMSFANGIARGSQYVAGENPSWMPGLVPFTFRNEFQAMPESRGLGGSLPVVLGLMAFWEDWDESHERRMRRTFHGDGAHYRGWRWRPEGRPRGYPTFEETPRGFLIHVSFDDENAASTQNALDDLVYSPIVLG